MKVGFGGAKLGFEYPPKPAFKFNQVKSKKHLSSHNIFPFVFEPSSNAFKFYFLQGPVTGINSNSLSQKDAGERDSREVKFQRFERSSQEVSRKLQVKRGSLTCIFQVVESLSIRDFLLLPGVKMSLLVL